MITIFALTSDISKTAIKWSMIIYYMHTRVAGFHTNIYITLYPQVYLLQKAIDEDNHNFSQTLQISQKLLSKIRCTF